MVWLYSVYTILIIFLLVYTGFGFRVLKEYERGVVYTLGRYYKVIGPGLRWVFPLLQSVEYVDVRVKSLDLKYQTCSTSEGTPVKFKSSVHYKVESPSKAINEVENYLELLQHSSESALKEIIGSSVDENLLSERGKILKKVKEELSKESSNWGLKIDNINIYDLEISDYKPRVRKKKESVKDKKDDFLLD